MDDLAMASQKLCVYTTVKESQCRELVGRVGSELEVWDSQCAAKAKREVIMWV